MIGTLVDLEDAKAVGRFSEMCVSDTATFIPCIVKGKAKQYMDLKQLYRIVLFLIPVMDFVVAPLQLPAPQLESALNKYSNLRGPLTAYSSQPSIKSSLPRYLLM